jgi:hypothetical protein
MQRPRRSVALQCGGGGIPRNDTGPWSPSAPPEAGKHRALQSGEGQAWRNGERQRPLDNPPEAGKAQGDRRGWNDEQNITTGGRRPPLECG